MTNASCPRVNYFLNPNILISGRLSGIDHRVNPSNSAAMHVPWTRSVISLPHAPRRPLLRLPVIETFGRTPKQRLRTMETRLAQILMGHRTESFERLS
jgi:hypothetical protein